MSTGRETERAHRRDAITIRNILETDDDVYRTPDEWTQVVWAAGGHRRHYGPNRSNVNGLLRRLVVEGDMRSRRNPDDGRSTQFRIVLDGG